MDALERDALVVLRLVRLIKNSFVPINRVPPELFSLIPDYYEHCEDRDLITLTHVCRRWRDIFTSRSSLWTRLHFSDFNMTDAYIQRSRSSPLELYIEDYRIINGAFASVIPHISQTKSLTANTFALSDFLGYFRCHLPFLEKVDLQTYFSGDKVVLDSSLFNGDLSALRDLRLNGLIIHLPWKMANLQVVNLQHRYHGYGTAQILDFFESAPLLHTILLRYPMPDSSDAPAGRIIHLRHLKMFSISTGLLHSSLLPHLLIPIGTPLTLKFDFHGEVPPFLGYLPERPLDFGNLSHMITTIDLLLGNGPKEVRLRGPSGSLRAIFSWRDDTGIKDSWILHFLGHPMCSTAQRLAISRYQHPRPGQAAESPVFQMFSVMNNLKTLMLTNCEILPFILALDPEQSPSDIVPCFGLDELVIYSQSFNIESFVRMAKNRRSRGALISLVKCVSAHRSWREEVLKLRKYVGRLEFGEDDKEPGWDDSIL